MKKSNDSNDLNNRSGGLYKNVNMSLKSANRLVLAGIAALALCLAFAVGNA